MTSPTSQDKSPHLAAITAREPRDLFARTLRTMALLVGACVLFVGVLSVSAVVITNKALDSSGREGATGREAAVEDTTKSATPKKPTLSPARGDVGSHPI